MNNKEKVTTFEVPGVSDVKVVWLPTSTDKWRWTGTCDRCKVQVAGCLQYMPNNQLGYHLCIKAHQDGVEYNCPYRKGHATAEAYAADRQNCIPGTLFFGDNEYQVLTNPVVADSEKTE